ncbi:hypothetical protein BDV25DRAFT_151727 [Aspergillus avenaceus]|uniref:Methyltransferase domain-containing protein n=1 Tax=Aspergillus avenaceus TaxID=36643 RepID=A0A5N6U0K7_ASPAV|nr:hypothetical protein BDV25DRAFT_151727 [Aspergillus avenaceus]
MIQAERAWNVQPYPCIAKLLFLHFDLSKSPIFDRIVSMLDTDSLLLDLGCALGQDIRRLVYDGAPAESIVGMDIHQEFIDVGYELFRDRHNLKARFIVGDFFKSCPGLEDLAGSIRVINSGYFMHLFTWEGQVDVAKRMISLMARREGDIITGVNFGNQTSGFWEKHLAVTGPMFLHDSASLSAIWRQIGQETQTHWRVWSSVEEDKEFRKLDAGGFRLRWFVELEHCVPANPCEYTMDKMSQKPDILQEHYGDRLMSDAHDDEV